jgi:hypothetical protein
VKTLFLFLSLFCTVSFTIAQSQTVSAVKVGNRIDVVVGNFFFTSYICNQDEKYPFFFPLNSPLSGSSVTSMRNGEYPHHSSLFFGCDRVNGGNYWQEDLSRGQIVSQGARIIESKGEKVVIEDDCIWQRPDAPAPVKDHRVITISAPSNKMTTLDFDISLEMLLDVTVEKTNHSLFSIRLDPDLSVRQGGTMLNADGKSGEKETFGCPSPWIDCFGKRLTGVEGVALMQHPSNIDFPSPWFTRDYGFISPTPMYWPQNNNSTHLRKGDVIRLRYRVAVHAFDTKQADIEKEYQIFSSQ